MEYAEKKKKKGKRKKNKNSEHQACTFKHDAQNMHHSPSNNYYELNERIKDIRTYSDIRLKRKRQRPRQSERGGDEGKGGKTAFETRTSRGKPRLTGLEAEAPAVSADGGFPPFRSNGAFHCRLTTAAIPAARHSAVTAFPVRLTVE